MALRWPKRALREEGSFLVESMVSALILIIVGLGVLEVIDRSAKLGGEQKYQAVAGNVAQTELEQVRALPLASQSHLRRTSARTVGGITYSIASRADWVNDQSGDANCQTPGASADYMKVSTVVTWPQMGTRKPVTLESVVSPGVRSFGENQGSLAVHVSDRNGNPVSGLQVGLTGATTLSDATSARPAKRDQQHPAMASVGEERGGVDGDDRGGVGAELAHDAGLGDPLEQQPRWHQRQ